MLTGLGQKVSTHSRPKAADPFLPTYHKRVSCFNTQPPEGGCLFPVQSFADTAVSTHSRPKAAAMPKSSINSNSIVSTHSRPKAAVIAHDGRNTQNNVSTHSRPKAAVLPPLVWRPVLQSFNTQPPEGGWLTLFLAIFHKSGFNTQPPEGGWEMLRPTIEGRAVSTHSRPKAAAVDIVANILDQSVSTHSRPKAAGPSIKRQPMPLQFQHTAARRRLAKQWKSSQ